jgi:glyoxylate/hydroxypyruvate reductase A
MQEYPGQQRQGLWAPLNRTPPSAFPVGVLGYGSIGASLTHTLRGLGYPVTALASAARTAPDGTAIVSGPEGLSRIARSALAVVNTLPLTGQTHGILNAAFFAEMREGSIVINLGRGAHLDEADLLAALDRGRPAMAALDAFSEEPLPEGHPFWSHERVIVTPHVAGNADPAAVTAFVAEGIRAFEAGRAPEGLVDRGVGY